MEGVAEMVSRAGHDLYLFEELWMKEDHDRIRRRLPEGYHMTGFFETSPAGACTGVAVFCSGLAVVSRFPIAEAEFSSFADHGEFTKALADGEVLVRKVTDWHVNFIWLTQPISFISRASGGSASSWTTRSPWTCS